MTVLIEKFGIKERAVAKSFGAEGTEELAGNELSKLLGIHELTAIARGTLFSSTHMDCL